MTIDELEYGLAPEGGRTGGDRTPPQDLDAERSVLGGMMISKDAIADVVEQLRGSDFYRPAHEAIYDAVTDLYGRGEPADAVTVADELTKRGDLVRVGGAPYLHTLIAAVPTAANAGYYARIVRERAVLRRLVEAGTRIVQLGYGADGGDVDELVNNAQAEVYAVTERRASEDYLPLSAIITGTVDEIESVGQRGGVMHGVPTGFADLDKLTNGLHPGQMIVLAARPAIGKSTLGIDIARSASIKHGLTSVVFSLEMSRNEITMRLLSAEAKVHLQKMRTGQMNEDDWRKVASTMGRISEAPLFIDDSPNMSLMEIRAKCRRLKQRHDLKLVVIDYLQLMSSGKRVESRQQEVSEFSRALKLLAKELEVPVIAISQLNRGPEQRTDKKPQMSDLRESGCLTADTMVLRADTGAATSLGELHALGARDVPVWALDERLQYVRRHLTHVFPTGVKPTYRLRLASGREVTATANHPFLTYDGWLPLGELTVGDRVGVSRHVPGPERATTWDERRVVLLAHLLAAGAYGTGSPVRYLTADPVCARTVETSVEVLDVAAVRADTGGTRAIVLRLGATGAAPEIDGPVAAWLDELGLLRTEPDERFVPEAVASLPKEQIALFVRHLWSAAGTVAVHAHGHGGQIAYRSPSRVLVEQVATLLLRFGISTRIVQPTAGGVPSWRLEVTGQDDQRRFLQEIGVVGGRAAVADRLLDSVRTAQAAAAAARAALAQEAVWQGVGQVVAGVPNQGGAPSVSGGIPVVAAPGSAEAAMGQVRVQVPPFGAVERPVGGTGRAPLAQVTAMLDAADFDVDAVNDVLWDRVMSIEEAGEQQVFDATVLGTHNFVANGIAAHNSIEQDADMVILLHREDAYERESPRAGEADLIVAKHRNGPTDTITVAFQGHYSRFVDMQG
ncbi:MAG: replicative DNA helicase [Cellulomonas sp.]|nr:replicative DNA helicase [Cellulomonas sp.]